MNKGAGYTCMIWKQKTILFIFLLLISGCPVFSQVKNEEDLKKQAAKAFDDEDYATGFKLYSTLVSNYPKDPEYNYRLGVCALLSESDKKKPILYLVIASKQEKEVEKEVFFYLGKAYHLNYQFDEALKYYSQYKQVGSSSMQKKLQIDREIQCCKNAKRLLANVQELVILDKKQLTQADYYRSYDLKEIGGKLLVKPVDFVSAADKKKKDKSIIYMPASKDVLYYASYGDKENNKDIYVVRRMPSGEWSKPENLGSPINTEYDEDYPFLHPNGNVLYFASKGHNSMGGYDIFKSEYDAGSRQWKTPVNLDFPINSPDDDYLFVTDSLEKIAFLSSSRQSPAGKIDVYKILTERRAAEYAFIKGTVIKKSDGQSVQSKIKIKNIETGEDAGTFVAETNGEYSIKIPNGGKYIFTVETPGMPTQSEGVTIPVAYNYKPYRQTIEYENQKLIITNFFETNDKDENNYAQYIQLIEEKAKMNVNAGDFDINPDNPLVNNNSPNNTKNNSGENTNENKVDTASTKNNPVTTNNTVKNNLNNKQLVEIAYNDAKDLQKEAVDLKKDATSAFSAANSKQDQANDKKQEVQETQNKINTETDPVKKQELATQLDKQKQEADLYDKQAKTANTIAQQLEVDANNKQKEADLNLQYAKALEEADKTKNNKQAISKLEGLQKQLEAISKEKSKSNALVESIKADAQNKEQELKNTEGKQEKINKEENDIKTQITDIDKQIEKTKDKNLIDNLKAQKEELTGDLNDKQKESQANQTKINTLKEESDALKSQAEYASNIVSGKIPDTTNEIKANTTNTVVTNNTNTVTTNNTNTVTTNNTNTVTTNTTEVNENTPASAFETKSKKFDDELVSINNSGNDLENNKKKSDILTQYVQATDAEIKQKKQELSKVKTGNEKTALNKEIKQLTDKKTELQKEVKLVATQVKEQEKQAAVAAKNNTKKDSTKTNANNTIATNNTPADTAKTKIISDNDDPRIQNINTLIAQSQTNFTEEKKVFSNLEYTDPKAVQLKKQADDKLNELYKNNTLLEQQLEQLKMEVAKENAGNNDKKIESLNKQADDLSTQALQLRKDAKTKTGAEKQTALNQILALEKQVTGLRYQAARLQYQSDDDNFETNKQAITQLTSQNTDTQNPDVQQAQELAKEAGKNKKEASRLREEAEAQNETEAKIGGLSNADEKEKEALKKQEEALAILKKLNPKVNTTTASKEKQVEEIKTKLGKEVQSSVNALKLLVDANKAEYLALHTDVNITEKKQGSKPEELDLKSKAENTFKQATDDYAKLGTIKDDSQKRDYLLAINIKLEESITQLRNAKKLLNGEEIVENNNTVTTNTVDINNNTVTTNTVDISNNTINTNTISTNNTVTTNTVDINNNTTNTNTVNTNTAVVNNNTATPSINEVKLSPQQTQEVKKSPEYQKYTALQKDIVKYNNQVLKDESVANEYKAKYEALQKEIADMPEIDLKKKKEKEAESYKTKSDSLQSIANDTRMLAETKKQESDNFVEGLDKKTSDNIITVAATDTKTNNTEAPKKYINYSPAFQNSANAKDMQLADLRDKTSSPENLKEQNQVITTYIKDIDTEIADKKKQQTAATNPGKKTELAQQISNLQTRKKELTNEKTTNDNIIKFATNNTTNTNTVSVNTNTVDVTNNAVNTNTVDVNNNTVSTNTVAVNSNTVSTNNTTNTNTVTTNNNTVNTNTANVSTNGFEVKNTNAYSNTNPIPVNEKLPDGLMFRVQIGAFKNPISPDRFAGLSPVGAESTNFGFIRYQVGMFADYQKANAVKNDMRKLKYNDAFVVAYRNGKRISLAEALDSLAKTGQDVSTNANSTAGITTNNNIPVNPEATNTNQTPAIINGELNKTEGLLFTVQIGVYGDNVAASRLFNLKPVFKEVLPTGYFRYTAGIYNSIDKVKAERQKVNALGIQDAFVSAYLNGQRIKINEALDKINAGGAKFPNENPIIFPDGTTNNTPANNITQPADNNVAQPTNNVQPVTNGVTEGPAPTAENGVKITEEGITFKVQIGAYSKQVPVEVVNNWLKIKSWPVKNILVNGLYVYSVGSFTENKFAKILRDEVKSLGMTDAYVVVYKDGKKLYGAEAAQYLNR